jgi:hypothetical protein
MNLEFENLVSFQKTRSVDLAARSDASFYCSFFAKHYGYSAIEKLYLHRYEIINGKSVAERFVRNNYIFAYFFYYDARNKLKRYE